MESRREEAKKNLKNLAHKVVSIVNSEPAKFIEYELVRRYVPENIVRDVNGIVTSCTWNFEHHTRKSYSALFAWLNEYENTNEFQGVANNISNIFDKPIETVINYLSKFLYREVEKGFNLEDINQLINDLEGKQPSWKIIAKMNGVVPKKGEILINENIKLRQAQKEDLIIERRRYDYLMRSRLFSQPHSILEINIDKGNPASIQYKLENVIVILCLYHEAAIGWKSYSMLTNSFSHFGGGTFTSGKSYSEQPLLILSKKDEKNLNNLYLKVEPLISEINIRSRLNTPLEISLRRYIDSIQLNRIIEEKILYAMMGIEALLLTNQPELRFRLATRSAQLLGHLNEDPSEVYSTMLNAYVYRSSYVHGSIIKNKDLDKAKKSLEEIQRYLRKILLLWILLGVTSKRKKKQFLKEIDLSLIEKNKINGLIYKIENVKKALTDVF